MIMPENFLNSFLLKLCGLSCLVSFLSLINDLLEPCICILLCQLVIQRIKLLRIAHCQLVPVLRVEFEQGSLVLSYGIQYHCKIAITDCAAVLRQFHFPVIVVDQLLRQVIRQILW